MRKIIIVGISVALLFSVAPALAQQAGPAVIEEAVIAYNSQNITYFEDHLAEDVIWMDEDGHAMLGKNIVLGFLRNQLNATPSRTLSVSNVRVGSTSDAAWATYAYTIEGGEVPIEGLNTTVFRRTTRGWEAVVVHGARNFAGHH